MSADDRRSPAALRGLLSLRPAPRRWPFAARVAGCTAVLVGITWAAGDIGAGLIATLGMFTADYGSRRPYINRAVQSALIAVALAAAVTIGVWSAHADWLAVAAVSTVAVVAVWLCTGLAVGPPGAFVFALACAAGVGVSASHRPAWQVGLLVLAGGAMAWMATMSAALTDPRRPEKAAVAAAGQAVAAYAEATADHAAARRTAADHIAARRTAAVALVNAWAVLIDYQPRGDRTNRSLAGLRRANHTLHNLFTDTMAAASMGRSMPPDTASLARGIGTFQAHPAVIADRDESRLQLRRPATVVQLIRALGPNAHCRRVMVRVAIATPLAGACAASFGISHAYWAMAAAVLMLHQGDHRIATVRRGAARILGTFAGLCLAALILSTHPSGLWLVAVLAVLQYAIKMSNVRNYALATVFTTATGLTIGTATHPVDVGELLTARALDTLIGCGIAIVVFLIAVNLQETDRIPECLRRTMRRILTMTEFLAHGDSSSLAARRARRELQESIFELNAAEDAARQGYPRNRATAARLSRIIGATEDLGFATIAASWAAEQGRARLFESAGADTYLAILGELSQSIASADPQLLSRELPPFAAPELRELAAAIAGS